MKAEHEQTDLGEGREGTTFVPSEEWIDEFEKQSSVKGFEEKLKRFARMRANMVAYAGKRVDDFYARELVQDAIDDTLDGVLAWYPERVSLEKHLFDAIKSRTRHDYVQAEKFQHRSFDAISASPALLADVESALAAERPSTVSTEIVSAAERALEALRRAAANDPDVLRLLDAYLAECVKKVDVIRVSGMTSKRYEAAVKRMRRLVLELPFEVRDAIRA